MFKQAKRRLTEIFTAAVLGISIGVGAVFTLSPKPAPEPDFDNQLWADIIQNDTVTFNYDANEPWRPDGQHTIAIQVEEALEIPSLLLLGGNPLGILTQHGASAADITDETADRVSGRDIEVHFIERAVDLNNWIWTPFSYYNDALFNTADVITLSMGYPHRGDQAYAYSAGNFDSAEEIERADEFWRRSGAIFIASGGNDGDDLSIDLERPAALHMLRSDTYLSIGAAFKGPDGKVYIEPYSSRSGVSFVTSNPYFSGFSYPYLRDEATIRARLDKIYSSVPEGFNKTGREIFYEQVRNLPDRYPEEVKAFMGPDILERCHVNFAAAEFEGKDALTADREWQREHPEEVLQGFINGLVDSIKYMQWYKGTFENGNMTGLHGTSFTAPYAGGMVAAMHELYPQMSEYDLVMAALIAAEPVDQVRRANGAYGDIEYTDNGRGLLHNSREAGFGYLSEEAYRNVLDKMASMLRADFTLATQEMRIDSGVIEFDNTAPSKAQATKNADTEDSPEAIDQPEERPADAIYNPTPKELQEAIDQANAQGGPVEPEMGKTRDYQIEVTDDIVAMRANLALQFAGGSGGVPPIITLISPDGGEFEISPTRLRGEMEFSLASTDGVAGNYTKGTWTIRVPEGIELDSARLTIHGSQLGGLVDKYLQQNVDDHRPDGNQQPSRDDNKLHLGGGDAIAPKSGSNPAP